VKVNLVLQSKATLPRINLGVKTMEELGEIVSESVVANVRASRKADGGSIKENQPSTERRKAASGRKWRGGIRPLIDKQFRLIRAKGNSYKVTASNNQAVVGFATPEIGKIAIYVQRMGYTGWFGVNKLAARAIRKVVRRRVVEILRRRRA